MAALSAFEHDILDQPQALLACAEAPLPVGLARLNLEKYDRIILTGMGSSDYVTIPFELSLAKLGLPVWRVQTGVLLERLEMIRGRTLLWITSQSGRSGEVVALLNRMQRRDCTIVATTNDDESPLAVAADVVLPLRFGSEATVSTKSYLTSLGMVHRAIAVAEGRTDEEAVHEIYAAAEGLSSVLARPDAKVDALVQRALQGGMPRFALVGAGADAATALTGALILKEAAKVPAEGFWGGAFRHGPMELAEKGLTVLLFGSGRAEDVTIPQLARDLPRTGCLTVAIAPEQSTREAHIELPAATDFSRLVQGMHVVQRFCVGVARGQGLEPGAFRHGGKITSAL